jgi:hypothetical protein
MDLDGGSAGSRLVWEDPRSSDPRNAARTALAWNGSSYGVLTTTRRRAYFGEVGLDGAVVTPFTEVGNDYYTHEFAGSVQLVFEAGSYYALSPRYVHFVSHVALQRLANDGEILAEAIIEAPAARFPAMVRSGDRFYVFTGDGTELAVRAFDDDLVLDDTRSATLQPPNGFLSAALDRTPDGDVLMAYTNGSWKTYSSNTVYVQRVRLPR